jgi:hypothetical protein
VNDLQCRPYCGQLWKLFVQTISHLVNHLIQFPLNHHQHGNDRYGHNLVRKRSEATSLIQNPKVKLSAMKVPPGKSRNHLNQIRESIAVQCPPTDRPQRPIHRIGPRIAGQSREALRNKSVADTTPGEAVDELVAGSSILRHNGRRCTSKRTKKH